MHLVISERKLEHIFVLHIYGCNLKLCRSSNVLAIDTFISPRINCFQRAQIFLEIYEYPRWPAWTDKFFLDLLSRCLWSRPRGRRAGKCQGPGRLETGLEILAAPFITVTVNLPVTSFSGPYHPSESSEHVTAQRVPSHPGSNRPLIRFKVPIKLTEHILTGAPSTKWTWPGRRESFLYPPVWSSLLLWNVWASNVLSVLCFEPETQDERFGQENPWTPFQIIHKAEHQRKKTNWDKLTYFVRVSATKSPVSHFYICSGSDF